ncbi:MAG: hypothetical protein HOI19_06740, partial [Rhodospirillaceae bacterium]|nr:hypothetical protein [Rhodospirillaceae bacterium]
MFSASTHNPFRLRKTIAANRTMDPDDILNTKSALGQLGHLDVNRNGLDDIATRPMPTRTIINGVKSFQRKQGLKVDGLMKPDGPTARRITSLIGDPTVGDGPDERAAPRKPKSASTAAAPWFESRHLKQVSNEAASSNGRMLGGLLNYNVNGDLPNLFASALRTGLSEGDGAQPVREFADFLRQLGAKKPDRVPGFEGEVLSKLTGADRDRIKRLADGPPPRPVNAYAHRPDDDDLRNSLRTMEHRNDMVWENGKWRARTPADRAPGDLRLLSEDGGGDAGGGESGEAGGNNRDENANPDRQPQL